MMKALAVEVAKFRGITATDIFGKDKRFRYSHPRQEAYWLIRRLMPGKSLPEIGRLFSADHTAILHGVAAVERRVLADPEYMAELSKLLRIGQRLTGGQ